MSGNVTVSVYSRHGNVTAEQTQLVEVVGREPDHARLARTLGAAVRSAAQALDLPLSVVVEELAEEEQ